MYCVSPTTTGSLQRKAGKDCVLSTPSMENPECGWARATWCSQYRRTEGSLTATSPQGGPTGKPPNSELPSLKFKASIHPYSDVTGLTPTLLLSVPTQCHCRLFDLPALAPLWIGGLLYFMSFHREQSPATQGVCSQLCQRAGVGARCLGQWTPNSTDISVSEPLSKYSIHLETV